MVAWPPVDGRVALISDGPADGSGAGGRRRAPTASEHFEVSSAQRARDNVTAVPYGDVYRYMVRSEPSSNRAVVSVVVADGWTVSRLASSIEEPAVLLVEGRAVILDGDSNPQSE